MQCWLPGCLAADPQLSSRRRPQEMKAVAKFIRQRGRVSIADIAENSAKLIRLQEEQEPKPTSG